MTVPSEVVRLMTRSQASWRRVLEGVFSADPALPRGIFVTPGPRLAGGRVRRGDDISPRCAHAAVGTPLIGPDLQQVTELPRDPQPAAAPLAGQRGTQARP